MKLSVIILNYNVEYFLFQCLLSVQKAIADLNAEIIVVDNNSSDGSCEMVRKYFPSVKLIANFENTGFPKGNNIGVDAAQGEFICILNPDTVVGENTLKEILIFLEINDKVGIVGPKLVDGTGKFLPESKRGIPTPYVALTKILGLYKIVPKYFSAYYATHLKHNQEGKVSILVGAFMMMKRELYLEVGGFDEKCFMYSDDIDLSYMVLKRGYQNYYLPHSPVIHYKGESTVRDGQYVKRFSDAMNFFYKKHFRISPIFNIFMKGGAFMFSLSKRFQKVTITEKPQEYILLSDNADLQKRLMDLVGTDVSLNNNISVNQIKSTSQLPTQIIFDSSQISYSDMIDIMTNLNHEKRTFRVYYKSDDGLEFLIGSDSSNDRGQISIISDVK